MASFVSALDYMLPHEGGMSNDPRDKGGKTKYGITQASLNRFIASHPDSDLPDDVFAVTLTQARTFYATAGYWLFDDVINQRVASKLFDMSVNMGPQQAIKLVQKILGVAIDGVCGSKTISAINAQDPNTVLAGLCRVSCEFYHAISTKGNNAVFLKGWLNRAMAVPE